MVEEAQQFGAHVIAMQYPTIEIILLQEMLRGIPEVTFVENRVQFSAALKYQPYSAIFSDSFAGSFGHTTPAGSDLIARHLAESIFPLLRR